MAKKKKKCLGWERQRGKMKKKKKKKKKKEIITRLLLGVKVEKKEIRGGEEWKKERKGNWWERVW